MIVIIFKCYVTYGIINEKLSPSTNLDKKETLTLKSWIILFIISIIHNSKSM